MKKICEFINKYYPIFYLLFGLPFVIGMFWLIGGKFIVLPIYISDSRLHLIIIPLIELLLLTFGLHISCKSSRKNRREVNWLVVLLFSLVNLVLIIILRNFYVKLALDEHSFVQAALKIAIPVIILLSLTAAFSLIKIIQQIVKLESSKAGFEESFISRPWQYIKKFWNHFWEDTAKSNRETTILFLGFCFIVGLSIRLINLGQLPPYVDEYAHTHAVYQLLTEGSYGYTRAFLPVTLPVFLSVKIFGQSLWAFRFPMVLLNMLSVFPLYGLTKKMNKKVGYISVLLFVLSPWILGVSKTIREYAVAPLFFYSIGYLLVGLLDWEKSSLKQYVKKNWWLVVILLLILIYSWVDRRSVLIINFAIYAVFALFAILKLLKGKPSKWLSALVVIGGLASIGLVIYRSGFLRRLLQDPSDFFRWNNRYVSVIFNSSNQQWYYLGFWGYLIVAFGALIALRVLFRKYHKADTVAGFAFLTFVTFVVGLAIRIPRGGFRYGALPHYWYLIVVAIFVYGIYVAFQRIFKRKWIGWLLWAMILFGFFTNYQGIYKAVAYTGGPASPVTGETHSIVEPALDFLNENLSENDILLMDTVKRYGEIIGVDLPDIEIINVNSINRDETISATDYVLDNPSGWIAITPHALSWISDIPREDAMMDGRSIEYLGTIGNVFVWHWTTP